MIIVFGTVCLDRLKRVPYFPKDGGYVEVEFEMELLGGEAANTANALQFWGDRPVLAGNPLGDSVEADRIRELVRERHLNLTELTRADDAGDTVTPVCEIFVTSTGERTMFGRGFSRIEHHASAAGIPWQNGAWFTAEPNMETLSREVVEEASKRDMRIYLMDYIRPDDPILPSSFWQSSTDWAGVRNNMQRNVRWLKDWVHSKGCFGILSDGPNGFVAGSPDRPVRAYPPFPAPEVVDTTGAGDMFRAGMLHGLNLDWPISQCLQFASAAGCLKCKTLGATAAVPTVAEICAHIDANSDVAQRYL